MRRLLSIVVALVLVSSAPAVAGGWRDQPGDLSVTVDTVSETYTLHGRGFNELGFPEGRVWINACTPGCTISFTASATGADFDVVRPFGHPGTYEAWALVRVEVGNSGKTKVVEVDRVTFEIP